MLLGKLSPAASGGVIIALIAAALLPSNLLRLQAASSDEILFRKQTIDLGRSESVTVADVNQDGRLDIVSGENWYEQAPPAKKGVGPNWIKHHFRDIPYTDGYIEDLSDLAIDVNGDGYPDIVSCSYWDEPLTWWENPGTQNKPWRKTIIQTGSPVEFAFLVDLLNTGKPEICCRSSAMRIFPFPGMRSQARAPMQNGFVISSINTVMATASAWATSIKMEGMTLLLPKDGLRHRSNPRNGKWIFHPEFDLGMTGFIYVADVNGDGLPDLVTSMAHNYGIFWYEQKKNSDGSRSWVKHVIDDVWSQAHAMTLVDLRHDGKIDLVTGKRYYAHEHDPGANEPLGVYWYEPVQSGGRLQWIRHIIDYSSRAGGGMQIPVIDIDGDGDLDIVVAGKSGLFLFENLTIDGR